MFLVLVSLVAMASAAPKGLLDSSSAYSPEIHLTPADIKALANIYPDPKLLGITMDSFNMRFMPDLWSVEIKDDQYILSMSLPDFEKKDIDVLATQGFIVIRVVHKEEGRIVRSHIAMGVLPVTLGPAGRWTYDGHFIKIVFPLPTKDHQNFIASSADEESTAVRLFTFEN